MADRAPAAGIPVWRAEAGGQARYRGSDRVGDLALTASYYGGVYGPYFPDGKRLSLTLACLVLTELALDGLIRVTPDDLILPARAPRGDADDVAQAVLRAMDRKSAPLPVDTWLRYLDHHRRAVTLVWRRLIHRGVATETKRRLPRRGPVFELTTMDATDWTRHWLIETVTDRDPVPAAAVALWRALGRVQLDGNEIAIPPRTVQRLRRTPLPGSLGPLFAALDRALARLPPRL